MSKEFSITEFEEVNKPLMASYVAVKKTIDEYSDLKKKFEAELFSEMVKYDVKSIDNDVLKATIVSASTSESIDIKEFEKQEPVDYAQLKEDYPKITTRKPSLRITVKK